MVKAGHWKQFREGCVAAAGGLQPLPKSLSQKTYETCLLRLLRAMGGAFVAERRLRHPSVGAAVFHFLEVIL